MASFVPIPDLISSQHPRASICLHYPASIVRAYSLRSWPAVKTDKSYYCRSSGWAIPRGFDLWKQDPVRTVNPRDDYTRNEDKKHPFDEKLSVVVSCHRHSIDFSLILTFTQKAGFYTDNFGIKISDIVKLTFRRNFMRKINISKEFYAYKILRASQFSSIFDTFNCGVVFGFLVKIVLADGQLLKTEKVKFQHWD